MAKKELIKLIQKSKISFDKLSFSEKVYIRCMKISLGKVTTYAELAKSLNCKSYQAIGNALRNNLYAPFVPCHRVIKSNGYVGGFMGMKSGPRIFDKIKLLRKEGVIVKDYIIDLSMFMFRF